LSSLAAYFLVGQIEFLSEPKLIFLERLNTAKGHWYFLGSLKSSLWSFYKFVFSQPENNIIGLLRLACCLSVSDKKGEK
jgi:hypothetical protein